MTPATDPRPFSDVLRDWLARHDLTPYAAAAHLGAHRMSIGRWLDGSPCAHERAYRLAMAYLDLPEAA